MEKVDSLRRMNVSDKVTIILRYFLFTNENVGVYQMVSWSLEHLGFTL